MARLRLSPQGDEVLAEWKGRASADDRELVAKVLGTLADGTWKDRWHTDPYPADGALTEIQPRVGLHVFVREALDEDVGVTVLDLETISVSPPA